MWKDIPDEYWKDYYEVNEFGEVRNKTTKKLIKGDLNSAGYHRVCLYHTPHKKRFFRHRLVAEAFIPNPENLPEVNHIDEDKSNNIVSNLEWVDRKTNERKNHQMGKGGKKYTPFRVYFENGEIKDYEFAPDLAAELNVTKNTILDYLHGKTKGYLNRGIIKIEYI